MGMLADRIGGRAIFTGLMLVVAVPTALIATAESYHTLLFICGRSRIRFSQIRA
jgi:nitrate/nitrite transporter NarK